MAAYLRLYVPAALSIASDFWRMSAVRTPNPYPNPNPNPNPNPTPNSNPEP